MAQRRRSGGRARRRDRARAAARTASPCINADDAHARRVARRRARRAGARVRRRSRSTRRRDVPCALHAARRRQRRSTLAHAARAMRRVDSRVPGRHMARNALAAAAAALAVGVSARRDRARARGVSCRSPGRLVGAARGARRARSSTTPTTRIRIRCARRSTCSRAAPAPRWLVLGDMGEVGAHGPRVPSRDRRVRARARASTRLYASARCAREARRGVRRRRASTSRRSTRSPRAVARRRAPATTVLVKGSRFMRMERVVAALAGAARGRRRTDAAAGSPSCSRRTCARSTSSATSRCARCWRRMTALVISFVVGPRMIAWLTRMKIGQSVRDDGPQTHLAKAGTPTMGGALILVSIIGHDAAVGRPRQPLRLGRAAGDGGLRRDRLGRRLPQGRPPQSEGPVGAREVPLAIGDRAGRRRLSRVLGLGAGQRAVRPAVRRLDRQRLQPRRCRPRPT